MKTVRLDGFKCKAARDQLGLSRGELARRSGVSVATIKRAENGEAIFIDTARALAEALSQPVERLLLSSEGAEERPAASLEVARKPASVAVLPFNVIGSGVDGAQLADGLVEDLIHRLSRSLFPVVAAGSTLSESARTMARKDLVRELGADYLVVGSAQHTGSRVLVTASVLRACDEQVIASEHYERPYVGVDVFAAQRELGARIVDQVGHLLMQCEARALMLREPSSLTAWELAVRGSFHFYAGTAAHNAEARRFFERAVTKDPGLMQAWYGLAMTHQRDIVNQWSANAGKSLGCMREVENAFRRHHPGEPGLAIVAAYVRVYAGEREAAMAWLEDAVHVNPNAVAAHSLYGQTLAMANEPERAIAEFETALHLSPLDSERWSIYTALALAHFVAERYHETVAWARKATGLQPTVPFPRSTLASALAYLGRVSEAQQELLAMRELAPSATVKGMATLMASTNQDIARRYQAGLKLAGLEA